MTVRGAREGDLGQLHDIDRLIFTDDAYPYFVLRQLLEVHGERFLILEHERELTGYAMLATTPDNQRHGWVLGLGVVPQARGNGYGRLLMHKAIERLAADEVAEVRLSVEPNNEVALNLYRSLHFTTVEPRQAYFGPGHDRLILARKLG
ncbi:GNAT family N-acetyltransferase [Kitasatospora sp. NBC_01266]|uniref:GNAT family N-acetyltransferase n=1 Tax=Kitasatospora sp. NBC_01266 TaxID=2903572 RepID=UPI002E352385|nr:GNAT family N-acetyltransferase [Kitasatospora sp. NBC_01266]